MMENEAGTCKRRFGFVPTSVWYFHKTAPLEMYVNDELARGTYARAYDVTQGRLSQFNPTIAEKIIKIWSREGDSILDPFAGRCRAMMAQYLKRRYTGYEISPKVCEQLKGILEQPNLAAREQKYTPVIWNADARSIRARDKFDLVFSCPPYWDVEDYNVAYEENVTGQLSDLHDYGQFLEIYGDIIKKLYAALKTDKYCVLVVADIRRDKHLIPFHADTIKLAEEANFGLHDVVINKLDSPSVVGVGNFIAHGYTAKAHEYILVFKKWGR